jgi:hypothetical protein
MNIQDEMSDDDVLRAAATSLSTLPVAGPPAAKAIMARGRARRRRTLTGLGLAGTAGAAALALGLTGAFGSAPAYSTGTIRTAAFTLTRNANGTDTLTINPQVLVVPSTLENDLAQYGIPAMVDVGSFCSTNPAPAGFFQVVTFSPKGTAAGQAVPGNGSGPQPTITINPSAMPAGTELSFGIFQLPTQEGVFTLIDKNSYTCTSTAPTTAPRAGSLAMYGGPAGS